MRAVGLKTLKNKLSEYVRLVRAGEVVLITDRDEVVAELRPPSAGRSEYVDDAAIAELVRKGSLRPPLRRVGEPPPSYPRVPLEELLRELDEDRNDR